jgi:hypothetical protein
MASSKSPEVYVINSLKYQRVYQTEIEKALRIA